MPSAIGRKKPRLSGPVSNDENDGVLPTDVLYDVLLRLPANDLCRLRLVCRSWRSLTSDPGFAKAHASRHPIVAGIRNYTNQVHLLDLSGNIVRRIDMPPATAKHAYGLTAQLDLLCATADNECSSYVVGSATGEVVASVPTGGRHRDDVPDNGLVPDDARFMDSSASVFGHVPSTGEYKVLRTTRYFCKGPPPLIMNTCNVMTLGGGGWRARPSPVGTDRNFRYRVVVDGAAYFLWKTDAIFAFDLATEEWRPDVLRGPLSSEELEFGHDLDSFRLLAMNGCLVMAHDKIGDDCSSMDLWFLDDMDVDRGVSTKRYSIPCGHRRVGHASRPPCPLHILSDGIVVIWAAERENVLKVYDPRTNMCANLTSVKGYSCMCMHPRSLLCPGIQS